MAHMDRLRQNCSYLYLCVVRQTYDILQQNNSIWTRIRAKVTITLGIREAKSIYSISINLFVYPLSTMICDDKTPQPTQIL